MILNMGSFEKTLVANADILFFVVLVEAIIIVFLVTYLLYKKWGVYDEVSSKNLDAEVKNLKAANNWRDEYYSVLRELNTLKSEIKKGSIQTISRSQQECNRWNVDPIKRTESINISYSDHAEYAKKEQEKGIYVRESQNEDGTLKSEVLFDNTDQEPASVPISVPRKYEYLDEASGGQFRNLLPSEEKCFFRTWDENGVRKFEFHGNVENALANINAIFDDVCDIEGKQNGATQIINVEPGVLDNNLKVETPAKIKLA